MFTQEPYNSIMFLSYLELLEILNKNNYSIIQQANQYVLLKDNEILANVDIENVKNYLASRPNLTYLNNKRIYNEYKDSKKDHIKLKAQEALNTVNLIIYIYAIRYLCNELNKTNRIFNLSY